MYERDRLRARKNKVRWRESKCSLAATALTTNTQTGKSVRLLGLMLMVFCLCKLYVCYSAICIEYAMLCLSIYEQKKLRVFSFDFRFLKRLTNAEKKANRNLLRLLLCACGMANAKFRFCSPEKPWTHPYGTILEIVYISQPFFTMICMSIPLRLGFCLLQLLQSIILAACYSMAEIRHRPLS